MFGDEYKKAMSFPVPEELMRETARKMQAAASEGSEAPKKKVSLLLWKRVLATAAVFCLVALSGVAYYRLSGAAGGDNAAPEQAPMLLADGALQEAGTALGAESQANHDATTAPRSTQPARDETLPKIKLELDASSAFGAAAAVAYRAEEAMNSENPWTVENSAEVTSLPVYRNTCLLDAGGLPVDESAALSYGELEALAKAAAEEAELTLLAHTGDDDSYTGDGRLVSYGARTEEGYRLHVLQNGDVRFTSTNAKQTNAAVPAPSSLESLRSAIWNQYQAMFRKFGLRNPVLNLTTEYTFGGEPSTRISVYDRSGSLSEQILSFRRAAPVAVWTPGGEYGLEAVPEVALYRQKELWKLEIGEYPLRTVEEAADTLYEGGYVTAAPAECEVSEEAVEGVELVYYGNARTEYVQPVYSFTVRLDRELARVPAEAPEGLNAYGVYLVAAVEPEYLLLPAE